MQYELKLSKWPALVVIVLVAVGGYFFQGTIFPMPKKDEIIKKVGASIISQIQSEIFAEQTSFMEDAIKRGNGKKAATKTLKQIQASDNITIVSIEVRRRFRFKRKLLSLTGKYRIKVSYTLGDAKSVRFKFFQLEIRSNTWRATSTSAISF